tara:strand:+ start:1869 stop:2144 length:276 start_codon:yes stop_codon:yes gene_type:complete
MDGFFMSNKKSLRMLKKLSTRLNKRMEDMRDIMDDMEIEFELLQKQIAKLELKKADTKSQTSTSDAPEEAESDDEDLDLENTTSVFVKPKF